MVHSSVLSCTDIKFELKFTRKVVFRFLLCFAWRQRTCVHRCAFRCADTHLFLNKIALTRAHETLLEKIINICKRYVRCLKNVSKSQNSLTLVFSRIKYKILDFWKMEIDILKILHRMIHSNIFLGLIYLTICVYIHRHFAVYFYLTFYICTDFDTILQPFLGNKKKTWNPKQ